MNDALKIENNDIMNKFQKTENILNDVQNIIEVSQLPVHTHRAFRKTCTSVFF